MSMRKGLAVYVAATCIVTAGLLTLVLRASRGLQTDALTIGLLCVLAISAELLSFAIVSNAARGTLSFIPFLAAIFVVPSGAALLAVIAAQSVSELVVRRSPLKALFNIAQHSLSVCVALLLYKTLGGVSLTSLTGIGLYKATLAIGLPVLLAVFTYFLSNVVLVTGFLTISMNRPLAAVWTEIFFPSIGFNLLAGPIIFLFSWMFAAYGPFAAAILWVPILGLRQVHKSKSDLERTNRELLELLVKSIEARDPYTSGHSRRVQKFSLIIARAIGLKEREIEQIGHAALLHDVGKIYEKYAPILAKADKLTPEEWTTMQEHPVDGANLVAMMSNLREIVPAIRHHHEKWDGSGYPDGLAGGDIPLASRIITFADTIDAMTSQRPYRRPLEQENVRAEILRYRARQFDPEITDRLLASPAWSSLFSPRSTEPKTQNLRIVRTGEFKLGAS